MSLTTERYLLRIPVQAIGQLLLSAGSRWGLRIPTIEIYHHRRLSFEAAQSFVSSKKSSPALLIKRNTAAWTPEVDQQLLDLRAQGQTWSEIGQVLNKSRQACNRRFDTALDPKLGRNFWREDPNRVEILQALVQRCFSWNEIADQLGTKASSCENQWRILRREQELGVSSLTESRVNPLDTKKTKPPRFSHKDAELLRAAVAEHGLDNWETIARDIFHSAFDTEQLRHQFMSQDRKRRVWSAAQDAELTLVVARSVVDIQGVTQDETTMSEHTWQSIASQIQGNHTGSECKTRWLKIKVLEMKRRSRTVQEREPIDVTRVSWTPEQSSRLCALIDHIKNGEARLHPDNGRKVDWAWVAEQMGEVFTKSQCKSRWTRMSKTTNSTKTGPWQQEEVEAMVKGLCEEGASWTVIYRDYLSSRSPKFIQGKWKSMLSNIRQDMTIHQRPWCESCSELFNEEIAEQLHRLENVWPELC